MIYKVVPAAMVISGGMDDCSDYFEKMINKYAKEGWQFYSMETATVESNPGCSLFGAAPTRTQTNLLVFCREGDAGENAAPKAPRYEPAVDVVSRPARPVRSAEAGWVCANCGTTNKPEHGMCKKCGTYRSAK